MGAVYDLRLSELDRSGTHVYGYRRNYVRRCYLCDNPTGWSCFTCGKDMCSECCKMHAPKVSFAGHPNKENNNGQGQ